MGRPAKKSGKGARTSKSAPATARKAETPRRTGAASAETSRRKLERVRVPVAARRDDSTEGRYVYCVIRSNEPLSFGPLGLGPEPSDVHTIHHRDIAAVVSKTPIVVQDPTRENVLRHQQVNETVM